jgi:hypothetical protein
VEPLPDRRGGRRVPVEHLDRESQHVLEVDLAAGLLALLVAVEHPEHQVFRDRRLVPRTLELGQVAPRFDHAVLRPLDLTRQLASRQELVGRRQRVRERRDQRCLVVEHGRNRLARRVFPEPMEMRERCGVERAGVDAFDPKTREPRLELACSLLGEGDRQDLGRGERVGGYLVRDPMRDGRGLAGTRAGQDGDRSAVRPGRLTLFLIQSLEDLLSVHTSNLAGKCDMS